MHKKITRREAVKKSAFTLVGASVLPGLLASAIRASGSNPPDQIREPAVVTVHPESDAAAVEVLRRGGNAVDAAVAALTTLCVVEPASVGFGGYGGSMAIYLAKQRRVTTIEFDSRAPLEFRPELFSDPAKANHGYLAVGVPGVVAGLDLALKKHGTQSWKDVSAHALHLAEDGIVVNAHLLKGLQSLAGTTDPESLKAYFPAGQPPELGELWTQKDLAAVIRAVGEGGAEAFYRGEIAQKIVKQVRENGGVLSEKDFNQFKALEGEPVHINYRGYDIYTPPPPSGGLTSLSILKTLEQFDLSQLEPWGADYFHLFAEAAKLAWAERFSQFGDPEVVRFSAKDLLSPAKAAERAEKIRAGKVAAVMPSAPESLHTVNVVIVDKDQNMVSLTATHGSGFGSHVVIGGLGLVLGHGMSRFTLDPSSPNFPAPGKRMQHNMSPTLILRDGRPAFAIGLPGGRMIVTVTAQLAASLIDFRALAEKTVLAPRLHTEGKEPLTLSPQTPPPVTARLNFLGHQVRLGAVAGPANVAIIDPATGKIDSSAGRSLQTA